MKLTGASLRQTLAQQCLVGLLLAVGLTGEASFLSHTHRSSIACLGKGTNVVHVEMRADVSEVPLLCRGGVCKGVCVGGGPARLICHLCLALLYCHDISADWNSAALWAGICGCGPCKCRDHHSGNPLVRLRHACKLDTTTGTMFIFALLRLFLSITDVPSSKVYELTAQVWCDITGCLITCVMCKLILEQLANALPAGS